jgi:protein-L-isoaspartate(D-aspartate) O-methyltransferase
LYSKNEIRYRIITQENLNKKKMIFSSKKELNNYLERKGLFENHLVKMAFEKVDRRDFVKNSLKDFAYQDRPLLVGERQTISQPTTVAFMLNVLNPKKDQKILDVGAGSGWVSCLLAQTVGKNGRVYAYEINKTVGEIGKRNVKNSGFQNVHYFVKNAAEEWKKFSPYDRIYCGAAFRKIPESLLGQLKEGGIMIAPTQKNDIRRIIRISDKRFEEEIFPGFIFVPFVGI